MSRPDAIAVVGGCGGAGASLLALALTVALEGTGIPALLLDLDPERGDIAGGLGSDGPRTVLDLAAVGPELTGEHLRSASIVHPSGIVLVPGAATADTASVAALAETVVGLADRPPLIIDAGSGATPVARRLAGRLPMLFVAPTDAAGCRVSRRTLRLLGAADGILLSVNRGSRPDELPPRTVARALGLPLAGVVPRVPAEATDLGAGVPRTGRRARLAEAAQCILGAFADEAGR